MSAPNHPNLNHKSYLGDGLYVGEKYGQIWLYTHNGIETLNEVCLEPEVIKEFFGYLERVRGLEISVKKREKPHWPGPPVAKNQADLDDDGGNDAA